MGELPFPSNTAMSAAAARSSIRGSAEPEVTRTDVGTVAETAGEIVADACGKIACHIQDELVDRVGETDVRPDLDLGLCIREFVVPLSPSVSFGGCPTSRRLSASRSTRQRG